MIRISSNVREAHVTDGSVEGQCHAWTLWVSVTDLGPVGWRSPDLRDDGVCLGEHTDVDRLLGAVIERPVPMQPRVRGVRSPSQTPRIAGYDSERAQAPENQIRLRS